MKFGLIYEMSTPKPHTPGKEYDVHWQALEQAVLAEEVGFDYIWEVEHHFLTEYSHASAPEVFLAAVAQRTKTIRIGSGVVLLPNKFNHPARVAERAAALDILSNGRYEFGTGRSITEAELGGFEIDPAESKAQWKEAVEIIPKMWKSTDEKPFSYKGKYIDMPPRNVIPKPIQVPHPPLWMAATQPNSFREAGERGLGVLCFGFNAINDMRDSIDGYYKEIKNPKMPVGDFANVNVGAAAVMFCDYDQKKARLAGVPAAAFFAVKALQLFAPWYGRDVPGYEFYTDMVKEGKVTFGNVEGGRPMDVDTLVKTGVLLIGTPDDLIESIEQYEKIGVTQMIFAVQAGALAHRDILRSLEIFGKEVIPHFKAKGHALPHGFKEYRTSLNSQARSFGDFGLNDLRASMGK